jgi:glycosyltransferase involved in cell wall biosynthesis
MRILIITVELPTEVNPNTMAPLTRQIESLRHLGHHVDILELRGIRKFKYIQALPRLWKAMRSVDIIHAHYGYCGWLARAQLHTPTVLSLMGGDVYGVPDTDGRILPSTRVVAKINQVVAQTMNAVIVKSAEMASLIEPVQAHIIPNGVDMQAFQPMDPQEARARLGWPEEARYVLFAGNPRNARKRFPLAQAAVAEAAKTMQEPLELVPLRGVTPAKVPLYMNASDALVMSSYKEGSPNVVKEAMACNTPVVSVPVGDVPELLEGVAGSTVCSDEAEQLAAGLLHAFAVGKQGANGRDALKRKRLDLESVAQRITDVYSNVLAGHRI